jgi:hypothetical protein
VDTPSNVDAPASPLAPAAVAPDTAAAVAAEMAAFCCLWGAKDL